jgi:type I restriction enzyme S subunit
MSIEWTSFRLGDATLKIGSGATPRGGSNVYLETGDIALIRSQNVHNEGFNEDGIVFLTEAHAAELNNVTVQEDDVLLNITGDSVARCCQVPEKQLPARVNQHVAIIRTKKDVLDPGFLRYALTSPAQQDLLLTLASSGATRNALTKSMLEDLEIDAPESVVEQGRIARVLGALDDKIELNRQTNRTLEELARALFAKWFADGDGELEPLEQHFEVGRGLSYTSASLTEGEGMPLHNLNTVLEGGGYKYSGIKWYKGEYKERHLVIPGDLVIANVEQGFEYLLIGYGALIPSRYGKEGLFSQDLFRMRPLPGTYLSNVFLYFLLRTQDFHDLVCGYSNGTTVNHLSIDGVKKPEFSVPSKERHDRFLEQVAPMLEKMEANEDENLTLATLRDTLLPKLMSGELRLKHE